GNRSDFLHSVRQMGFLQQQGPPHTAEVRQEPDRRRERCFLLSILPFLFLSSYSLLLLVTHPDDLPCPTSGVPVTGKVVMDFQIIRLYRRGLDRALPGLKTQTQQPGIDTQLPGKIMGDTQVLGHEMHAKPAAE